MYLEGWPYVGPGAGSAHRVDLLYSGSNSLIPTLTIAVILIATTIMIAVVVTLWFKTYNTIAEYIIKQYKVIV